MFIFSNTCGYKLSLWWPRLVSLRCKSPIQDTFQGLPKSVNLSLRQFHDEQPWLAIPCRCTALAVDVCVFPEPRALFASFFKEPWPWPCPFIDNMESRDIEATVSLATYSNIDLSLINTGNNSKVPSIFRVCDYYTNSCLFWKTLTGL